MRVSRTVDWQSVPPSDANERAIAVWYDCRMAFALSLAGIAWIVLAVSLVVVRLLVDEDVNSFNWPSDEGPGGWITAWIVVSSAILAAIPAGGLAWLLLRIPA